MTSVYPLKCWKYTLPLGYSEMNMQYYWECKIYDISFLNMFFENFIQCIFVTFFPILQLLPDPHLPTLPTSCPFRESIFRHKQFKKSSVLRYSTIVRGLMMTFLKLNTGFSLNVYVFIWKEKKCQVPQLSLYPWRHQATQLRTTRVSGTWLKSNSENSPWLT